LRRKRATFTHDGKPADLPSAALDALEWVRCWRDRGAAWALLTDEGKARVHRCIAALEEHLAPHLPHRFEARPEGADDA
jgi:hypothetical protein